MTLFYYCGITRQKRALYAGRNFAHDKEFFRGYLDRLGDRLHLIELGEGETWEQVFSG
jgi:hypothetical protein